MGYQQLTGWHLKSRINIRGFNASIQKKNTASIVFFLRVLHSSHILCIHLVISTSLEEKNIEVTNFLVFSPPLHNFAGESSLFQFTMPGYNWRITERNHETFLRTVGV